MGGTLPQFQRPFLLFDYQWSGFDHPNLASSSIGGNQVTHDQFQQWQVTVRKGINPRWQWNVSVPFKHHNRFVENGEQISLFGLGDATVGAFWLPINTLDSSKKIKHFLRVGSNLQVPTGKYQQRDEELRTLPAAFQLGNGSYGAQVDLNYAVQYNSWGVNLNSNYTRFTENELGMKPGTAWINRFTFFKTIELVDSRMFPSMVAMYESYEASHSFGVVDNGTYGKRFSGQVSLDWLKGRFMAGVRAGLPIYQDIPEVQPTLSFNGGITVGWMFMEKRD